MTAASVAWGSAGSLGAELTESQAAFRVFAAAGGLVLLGLVLLVLTIWWWRGTRPESPALGPLEVMGDRRWASAAESERRRLLEEFRPEGAEPMNLYVEPSPVDLSVLAREAPASFDDLREPSIDPEALEIQSEAAVDDVDAVDGSSSAPPSDPSADDVDGTVAMTVPSLPSLTVLPSLPTPPSLPSLPVLSESSELPVAQVEAPDRFDGSASTSFAPPGPAAAANDDASEAMLSPDRHVSPNAGE